MNNSREDLLAPIRSKLPEDLVRADVIMVKVRSRTGLRRHSGWLLRREDDVIRKSRSPIILEGSCKYSRFSCFLSKQVCYIVIVQESQFLGYKQQTLWFIQGIESINTLFLGFMPKPQEQEQSSFSKFSGEQSCVALIPVCS